MLDLQINGYVGVDFNSDDLTVDQLRQACRALSRDGVSGVLATIITADLVSMEHRIHQIARFCDLDPEIGSMIQGIHIEGPFLSPLPGYIGAHPAEHAGPANLEAAQRLLDAAEGKTKLFTLAPEQDPDSIVTSWLVGQGVVVAAGHCDPTLDELWSAIDAGLSAFPHLGNGCPLKMHRHDNIIQRALSLSDRLMLCFIADGAHVPLFVLKNYLACAGLDHCLIVSDTISAAGQGPGVYRIGDQQVRVGEDLVPWAEDRSHFVGSACPLKVMRQNLQQMGYNEQQLHQLFNVNPRKLIAAETPLTLN